MAIDYEKLEKLLPSPLFTSMINRALSEGWLDELIKDWYKEIVKTTAVQTDTDSTKVDKEKYEHLVSLLQANVDSLMFYEMGQLCEDIQRQCKDFLNRWDNNCITDVARGVLYDYDTKKDQIIFNLTNTENEVKIRHLREEKLVGLEEYLDEFWDDIPDIPHNNERGEW